LSIDRVRAFEKDGRFEPTPAAEVIGTKFIDDHVPAHWDRQRHSE